MEIRSFIPLIVLIMLVLYVIYRRMKKRTLKRTDSTPTYKKVFSLLFGIISGIAYYFLSVSSSTVVYSTLVDRSSPYIARHIGILIMALIAVIAFLVISSRLWARWRKVFGYTCIGLSITIFIPILKMYKHQETITVIEQIKINFPSFVIGTTALVLFLTGTLVAYSQYVRDKKVMTEKDVAINRSENESRN